MTPGRRTRQPAAAEVPTSTSRSRIPGLALGAVLMGLYSLPVSFNPADVVVIAVSGAVAVFLAPPVSVPALLRTMRPEGLRSE